MMTHKNKCEFKKMCPWVNGKLRKCGFLTDKRECQEYQEYSVDSKNKTGLDGR